MSSFGATAAATTAVPVAGSALPARPAAEPEFGPHVRVFGPGTPAAEIQAAFDDAAPGPDGSGTGPGERHAFLFKPGTYRVDARLGPHTSVAGLGPAPEDVTIHGALRTAGRPRPGAGGAVPAALRRVAENLALVPAGGGPAGAPEKPFLFVDDAGAYRVFLPALRQGGPGTVWGRSAYGWSVPIDYFFVARPSDSVRALNRALAQGRHLLLTPGVYRLADTVRVKWAGTVVLGLGSVTLAPVGGRVPMTVADARGVRIAGLMFDAGPDTPPVLLEVGRGGGRCDPREPASVQDVFFRIGGAEDGRAATALVVHSDHVLLDRVWAWRAGQGTGAGWAAGGATDGCAPEVPDHPEVRFHDLTAVPYGGAGVSDHVIDGAGGAAHGTAAVAG